MEIYLQSFFTLACTFIIVLNLNSFPTSLGDHSKEYNICSQTFNCGNLTGLSYPFYGHDRPSYCGHPGFELLDCDQQSEQIKIMILSQQFYVVGINSTSFTINVSREDYYNKFGCPAATLTNITIDFSIFQYTSVNDNITLLYGNCASPCSNSTELKPMVYPCPMDSTNDKLLVCFLTREMIIRNNISDVCPNRLFLPVSKSDYEAIDESKNLLDVQNGVWSGFQLKWSAKDELCQQCLRSGGQCGHDWVSNKFFCFCSDESKCPFSGSTSDKKTLSKSMIAIIASFSSLGIVLIVTLAWYLKRKYSPANQAREDAETRRKQDVEAFLKNYGTPGPKRYTYTDLKRITNHFKDKIGEGGYGAVYKGILHNGQVVAVKFLKKLGGDTGEFINEVASIGMTNHVNVVTLLGFCYESRKRALVYEFMPNGSLEKFIYGGNNQVLEWEILFQIAIGIGKGLEYLHGGCNTRILHFDIKPHNILLDENFGPKISDFGLAKSCPQKDSIISMSEARGTVGYIAPEVFLRSFGGVSYKSDVYSYGMLVLEMVGCRKRAENDSDINNGHNFPKWIYKQLEKGEEIRSDDENLSKEEKELQRKMILVSLWCVQTNPSSRPAMSKVVEMLEGTLDSLQMPPATSLSSSSRSQMNCPTSTTISA